MKESILMKVAFIGMVASAWLFYLSAKAGVL
jgi:hypothetical protein